MKPLDPLVKLLENPPDGVTVKYKDAPYEMEMHANLSTTFTVYGILLIPCSIVLFMIFIHSFPMACISRSCSLSQFFYYNFHFMPTSHIIMGILSIFLFWCGIFFILRGYSLRKTTYRIVIAENRDLTVSRVTPFSKRTIFFAHDSRRSQWFTASDWDEDDTPSAYSIELENDSGENISLQVDHDVRKWFLELIELIEPKTAPGVSDAGR